MTFNLIDEPWIDVVLLDGSPAELSLRDVLLRAREVRELAGEVPQMAIALLRLLLAVLYRAYDAPGPARDELEDLWEHVWEQQGFDEEVLEEYFESVHPRFDLFGDEPFYQTAGLSYGDGHYDPVSEIMPDVPKPEKYLFSLRARQCVTSLALDEAARYLVLTQAYDPAGIKSPVQGNTHVNKGKVYAPKGAVGTGWCGAIGGVYLEGGNLFQTLALNWVLYDPLTGRGNVLGIEGDLPPWERPPHGPDLEERAPVGPVDLLTWQSRRIRLVADEDGRRVVGAVLCYGDITTAVDKQDREMMSAWRGSEQQKKRLGTVHTPLMPLTHQPSRALWRGLPALVASGQVDATGTALETRPGVVRWAESLSVSRGLLPAGFPVAIHAQGMSYGTQSSVFEDGIDDRIDMSLVLLRHDGEAQRVVVDMVARAEEAVRLLVRFVQNVEVASGDKRRYASMTDGAATAVREGVRERAYDELDGLFRRRIARLGPDADLFAYGDEWRRETFGVLWSIAQSYLASSGIPLFVEREQRTPGRALAMLRQGLSRVLLNPAAPSSDGAQVKKNEEEAHVSGI